MEPILVVMAAGMGSRYGGNKQIDPVTQEGDIIMDFSLFDAYRAGFRRVVFVIKKDFEEAFRANREERSGRKMEQTYVFQELEDLPEGYAVPEGRTKPWGTMHALLAARKVIDAPFAVINADDYYGREGFAAIYDFLRNQADPGHYCMVGFNVENTLSENGTVSRGICREENGLLTYIEEHYEVGRTESGITGTTGDGTVHQLPEGTPVSMNLWGFDQSFIPYLSKALPAYLDVILAENPLKGETALPTGVFDKVRSGEASVAVLHSGDRWFGVTYKEDKPEVMARLAEMKQTGIYPEHLWD